MNVLIMSMHVTTSVLTLLDPIYVPVKTDTNWMTPRLHV